jgi:hypothetical protein
MARFKRIVTADRRAAPRVSASKAVPHRITKLASGQEVKLVNIGINGTVLINCSKMLSPGSYTRLKLQVPGAMINLEGRIRRCRVISLKYGKIQFEAAIILDGGLPKLLAERLQPQEEKCLPTEPIESPASNLELKILPETALLWVGKTPEAIAET